MRNKDIITNIKCIQKDNSDIRRYYTGNIKYNYLDFLINGINGIEEKKLKTSEPYRINLVIINGRELYDINKELKSFANALRNANGNVWILDVAIPKKEYMYKLLGNNRSIGTITKAFHKFLYEIELSEYLVSWICSIQYNTDETRIYFLFFENEPSFYNHGIDDLIYRKELVDLDSLDYFKGELLRGISHLRNILDYDSLKDMYLGLIQI